MITQTELKKLLHYDPKTGVFTWLVDRGLRATKGRRAGGVARAKRSPLYWRISIANKKYMASRLACLYMTGEWPKNEMDHSDRDSLNNAWDNLKPATRYQNEANKGAYRNNRCGLKGVRITSSGKYQAAIQRRWKRVHLGMFDTAEAAAKAYERAAA